MKYTKRILSLLLSLTLVLGLLPAGVLAVDESSSATTESISASTVMDNIAAKYVESGVAADGNCQWLAADMVVYAELFPETARKLSSEQIQAALDKIINNAATSNKPGDLAKDIIALRALGYDARNVITARNEQLDVVKKLTDMVDAKSSDVSNVYTLPYVLIALQQGSGYATQEQINWMLDEAVKGKEGDWGWGNTKYGVDGAAPMVLALAPYYESNEDVKNALVETLPKIAEKQGTSGAMLGYGDKDNAASTGLALAAYAALKQDGPNKDGKTLTDGLMTQVADTLDGFNPTNNSFNTEQGFRGLLAAAKKDRVYDFISMPMNVAKATRERCPVEFNVIPSNATIEVKKEEVKQTANSDGKYYLESGDYTYTVSKDGYVTKNGSFTITDEQAAKHDKQSISVSLILAVPEETPSNINVTVNVMVPPVKMDKLYTYKYDSNVYTNLVTDASVTVASGTTARDAMVSVLDKNNITYYEQIDGYFPTIGSWTESERGNKSGWMYMVNGSLPSVAAQNYILTQNSTVTWFYTDDYTNDYGSENESTDSNTSTSTTTTPEFSDVSAGSYYAEAVEWAVKKGITVGTSDTTFSPDDNCTREQMAMFLWKAAGSPEPKQTGANFTDLPGGSTAKAMLWVAEQNITSGTSDTTFSPETTCTRAQMAAFLYRYAGSPAVSGTCAFADVSAEDYYYNAVLWCAHQSITAGTGGDNFSPDAPCTRGQMVTFLYRFLGNHS